VKRGGSLKRRTRLKAHSERGLVYLEELIEMRPLVLARAGHMCEVRLEGCEYAIAHIHHRLRRSQGGKNTMENLVGCCMECHARIHANPDWSYRMGWLNRRPT
jgi:5-methylcytosine-specific restriction endonuclease McrA